eukprot:763612-Hanusia_phi.AAC.11
MSSCGHNVAPRSEATRLDHKQRHRSGQERRHLLPERPAEALSGGEDRMLQVALTDAAAVRSSSQVIAAC